MRHHERLDGGRDWDFYDERATEPRMTMRRADGETATVRRVLDAEDLRRYGATEVPADTPGAYGVQWDQSDVFAWLRQGLLNGVWWGYDWDSRDIRWNVDGDMGTVRIHGTRFGRPAVITVRAWSEDWDVWDALWDMGAPEVRLDEWVENHIVKVEEEEVIGLSRKRAPARKSAAKRTTKGSPARSNVRKNSSKRMRK